MNADGNMPYDICEDEVALDYIETEMAKRGGYIICSILQYEQSLRGRGENLSLAFLTRSDTN